MNWKEIFDTAEKYRRIESELKASDFSGNMREEIAKRLGMSISNADRYKTFNNLLPEVQNLVRDYNIGMSNILPIASHNNYEQKEIYSIFLTAISEGNFINRKCADTIIKRYRKGETSWSKIKPYCLEFIHPSPKISPQKEKVKETDIFNTIDLNGKEFEEWVKEQLEQCGFIDVRLTQASYDNGKDIIARKDGLTYIFQCKKFSDTNEPIGLDALKEIYFAKEQRHNVAVVITNGRIPKRISNTAEEKGILCWNLKTLQIPAHLSTVSDKN